MEAPRPDVVIDANTAIALLLDEPAAEVVEALVADTSSRMSTVNAAEAVDVMVRVHGGDPNEVIAQVDGLLSAVAPIPATADIATRAGELRARHWRRDQRVSLADCFLLASAEPGGRIATLDRTLRAVAREEGYEVVDLA